MKFSGINMNKKISESPHPLKNFQPLEKRSKSITDKIAPVSTLENFAPNTCKNTSYCKLCNSNGHEISYCKKYPNVKSRKARGRELNLCIQCSSTWDKSEANKGNFNKLLFKFD